MTVDIMKMLVFAAKVGILDNERYSNIIDQVNTPIDRQVLYSFISNIFILKNFVTSYSDALAFYNVVLTCINTTSH